MHCTSYFQLTYSDNGHTNSRYVPQWTTSHIQGVVWMSSSASLHLKVHSFTIEDNHSRWGFFCSRPWWPLGQQNANSNTSVVQSWGDLTAQCNIILPHMSWLGGKWCLFVSITSHEAVLQGTLAVLLCTVTVLYGKWEWGLIPEDSVSLGYVPLYFVLVMRKTTRGDIEETMSTSSNARTIVCGSSSFTL